MDCLRNILFRSDSEYMYLTLRVLSVYIMWPLKNGVICFALKHKENQSFFSEKEHVMNLIYHRILYLFSGKVYSLFIKCYEYI